ncbi:hypothetical protein PspLS_06165 [Pyricularia sp. CBS 133598]|nr:hypothetical protein PspLS_06165 [Pyricularia sp. CBS 133598]
MQTSGQIIKNSENKWLSDLRGSVQPQQRGQKREVVWVRRSGGRRLQILMHPKWLRRLCRRSVNSPQQPTVQYMYLCSLANPTEACKVPSSFTPVGL